MSITKVEIEGAGADRELFSGLVRLHVLHHASEGPVYGVGLMEELARHGYRISPGSLYPMLHGLEKKGYLEVSEERVGRTRRRVYRATEEGRAALERAKEQVRALWRELVGEERAS